MEAKDAGNNSFRTAALRHCAWALMMNHSGPCFKKGHSFGRIIAEIARIPVCFELIEIRTTSIFISAFSEFFNLRNLLQTVFLLLLISIISKTAHCFFRVYSYLGLYDSGLSFGSVRAMYITVPGLHSRITTSWQGGVSF